MSLIKSNLGTIMVHRTYRFVLLIAVVFSIYTFTSQAHSEMIHDFASWNGVLLQGKLTGNFEYYFEVQNRLNQTLNNRNTFIIRPALRYSFSEQFSLWLGYGWMPIFSPFREENRIWQQVLYQDEVGLWQLAGRVRFDERWLSQTSEVSHRGRAMFRTLRFMDDKRDFALCGWDELFYNINSIPNGPMSGFDQNRFFAGINFKIGENARLEPGYLSVVVNQTDPQSDVITHAFAIYTVVNF
jgi:hypothetical protein